MHQENKNRDTILVLLLLIAALTRLLPHPDNFTPLGAIALFGGTFIANKRMAIVIPVTVMFLSDILLQILYGTGFHSTMVFVYGALVLIATLGFWLRKRVQRQTIMVSSLVGSVLFFFVTNFGMWLTGYYGFGENSLWNCFIAGIPFFRGTIMGDLFFNLALFGSYSIIRWRFPMLVR